MLTATPTEEIKLILRKTSLDNIFDEVHGAPIKKEVVVQEIIAKRNIQLSSAVFVGDSISDYEAAKNNNLDFCLRAECYESSDIQQCKQQVSLNTPICQIAIVECVMDD